jgi:hypothetical protein
MLPGASDCSRSISTSTCITLPGLRHHTNRTTDPNTRVFEVKIEVPDKVIFAGQVSFSNTYNVRVAMHGESNVSVEANVIRAK